MRRILNTFIQHSRTNMRKISKVFIQHRYNLSSVKYSTNSRRTIKIILYAICYMLFATISLISCRNQRTAQEKKNIQAVEVITVNIGTVNRSVTLYGAIYGSSQVTIYPKIAGRVTQIVKPEGSMVNEGDTVLYILNDIPGMDYKPGPVLSPIAGIVGKVYVDIGQSVAPQIPVATVANYTEQVKVKAPISDQDLPYVKKGTTAQVSVTTLDNEIFSGTVTNISSILDPMSGSATIEITIPNQNRRLIPGMACRVNLLLEQKKDVITLPLTALFSNNYTKVLVVDKDNIARFREIKVGLMGDELVEIKSGLAIGEKVITTGKEWISDGEKVIPIEISQ
ncbi:MAG: efflux RND transporter periplasmic adaptor subunit [candidate division WOR-3 bacterium]|nr:efflux RND transporter periplasmic adaptor subunit [candidate division WOR-3 bacterium]